MRPRLWKHACGTALFAALFLALAPATLWVADLLYLVPLGLAVAAVVRVRLTRTAAHRPFWLWYAPAVLLMAAGDVTWTVLELLGEEPTPSPADVFYVAGGVLAAVAMLRGSRTWSWLRSARTLIDAAVLAAAVLAIGGTLLVAPLASGQLDATLVLALVFNGLGVLALVPALFLCLSSSRGVPLPILLVALGLVSRVVADGIYSWLAATGNYDSGHPVNLLWMAEYALAAVAATLSLRPREAARPRHSTERDVGLGLLLFGVLALLAFWLFHGRETWAGALFAGALAVMVVRFMLTARELRRMAGELAAALAERERLELTDPLTGLRNRAALEDHLRGIGGPIGVVRLELETGDLGSSQRDALAVEAAARLRSAAGAEPLLARVGASEFVVVVGIPALTEAAGERLRGAISREPFAAGAGAVGARVGVAWAPDHGDTGAALLHAAARARDLAARCGGNQVRVAGEHADLAVLERLAEAVDRRRGVPGHAPAVGCWAAAVAQHLGLSAAAVERCDLAGRLHDVGLVSAPDALLRRPHLVERDGDVRLENHPLARADLAPDVERALGEAAPAVARHYEPYSSAPPVEACVVAVCNAWATLREGRPGRPPRSVEAARAQLLARSGTAYAPDVLRAFLQLEASGAVGYDAQARPEPVAGRADHVLVAAAQTAAAVEPRRRTRAPRSRLTLAAAAAVLVAWAGTVAALHIGVSRDYARANHLVAADSALHELEHLYERHLAGQLDDRAALNLGRRYGKQLSFHLSRSRPSPTLAATMRAVEASGGAIDDAAARGDRRAEQRQVRALQDRLAALDPVIDAEGRRMEAAAAAADARAWWLTAVSAVLAWSTAGLMLALFLRRRRALERERTRAAHEAGERSALRDSERRFRALVQHASDAVLVIDAFGTVTFVTEAVERLLGRPAAAVHGTSFEALVAEDDRERLADLLLAARRMPEASVGDLTLLHAGGHAVPADLRVLDRSDDADVRGVVLTLRDVSEQRRLESQLRHSALIDRRTGLANRACFEDWLQSALARGERVSAVLIDLDDFKTINDSLGHPAGDRCLVAYGERLRDAVAGRGHVARLGGDEFAVLVEDVADAAQVQALARELTDAAAGAVRLDGGEVPLTASAGIAVSSPGDLAEDVLRAADTAAHAAKARGAGHVVAYSPSMHAHAVRRLGLRTALAAAVEREELELAFQPVVEVESGETQGVEALLRWRTPEGEPISPADFIPVAEASGLIVPLGAWVLERACADVAPLGALAVAVNVSAVQLRSSGFVGTVVRALEHSGLEPERLVLELTESALMDDLAEVQETFRALRALGVRIAIDDFGTGFSSLSTLGDLPIDVLKVDRSFVAAMDGSPRREGLIAGVLSLADRLGLPVVAEGIETAEQLEALRGMGCRWAQGYHLGRPGPLSAVQAVDAPPSGLR